MEEKERSRKRIEKHTAWEREKQQINVQYADTESKLNKICSHVFFSLKPQLASGKNQSWEKQSILNCPRAPVLSQ